MRTCASRCYILGNSSERYQKTVRKPPSAENILVMPISDAAFAGRKRPELGSWVLTVSGWERVSEALDISARELDVLKGFFDDENTAATASRLGLSPHTVQTYQRRLYRKLDVSSRSAAVLRVFSEYLSLDAAK